MKYSSFPVNNILDKNRGKQYYLKCCALLGSMTSYVFSGSVKHETCEHGRLDGFSHLLPVNPFPHRAFHVRIKVLWKVSLNT